jgi:hypothetical protein
MSRKPKPAVTKEAIRGLKYLRAFEELLAPLRTVPAHGNRQFQMHQYVQLLLLYFFNPILTSMRSIQQATGLENVQETVGVKKTSLGAMSESAGYVFDPELMVPILQQVMDKIQPNRRDEFLWNLPGTPTAVDGSFLRCLPRMAWAIFRVQSEKNGVRLHLQFDLLKQSPSEIEITEALGSEKKVLRKHLKPGTLYLMDRGFVDYKLYQAIHDRPAFFVARLKDNSSYEAKEALPLSSHDRAAGVLSDERVTMGSAFTEGHLTAPVRRVVIRDPEKESEIILLTNTDLTGEQLALLYRYRWQIELFFRWFKCILGCNHWISTTRMGLTMQVYVAILASLLIRLWTDRKPTKRTFEMICLYFQGWATEKELFAHIESLKKVD